MPDSDTSCGCAVLIPVALLASLLVVGRDVVVVAVDGVGKGLGGALEGTKAGVAVRLSVGGREGEGDGDGAADGRAALIILDVS